MCGERPTGSVGDEEKILLSQEVCLLLSKLSLYADVRRGEIY
jgi:hypothetical protein